jgi:ferrous-iron efflux pump FieF
VQDGRSQVSSERRIRLLKLATWWSVATAVLLIVAKGAAWLNTGSVSLLASLIDSLMDAAASAINLVAVRLALQPADEEHRFGHGKAESLAGLAQAAFICGSALLLLSEAIDRIIHPRPLEDVALGVWVMVLSIVATIVLLGIQRYTIRETGSVAIKADSLHYFTDLLTNLSVIAALFLAASGWSMADQHLMDRELPEDVQQQIASIVLEHPEVHAVHDLRTRQSGQTRFIQLHIEMDGKMTLARAHGIGDEVMLRLREAMPDADIMIHQDPEDDSSPHVPGERIT